jgi:hypothetical protein
MKTELDCQAAQPAQAGVNFKYDFFVPGGCRRIGSLIPMLLVAAVLACTQLSTTASAQSLNWDEKCVDDMWNAYNTAFYNEDGQSYAVFTSEAGGSTITEFWEEAEEIEMAEDAYDWATRANNGLGDPSDISSQINELCEGFVAHNGSTWWQGDQFDDDLDWASMAFARAYQITGNSSWLSDATNNFNYVWANGQVDGKTDGSWGLTQERGTERMYANVNFTFVIAGYLLYESTGDSTYKSEADAIFTWAKTNLYVYNYLPNQSESGSGICSIIYNRNDSQVGGASQYSPEIKDCMYNYGIAIWAADLEGQSSMAKTVANWMMYNVHAASGDTGQPYNGTYDGYNVLPDYTEGGNNSGNDCGYDGIGLRGFGVALNDGTLVNPDALPFAQANLQSAWNNSSGSLEWCDWESSPTGTGYSWGDSAALAGMFDIPAPIRLVQNPGIVNGSSTSVTVTFPTNTLAGDLLVVNLAGDSGATFSAPSGWVFVTSHAGADEKCSVWYYPNCPAGMNSATFTYTGSSFGDAMATEWAGLSSVDVTGNADTGSGTSLTVNNSANTSSSDEVAITEFIEYLNTAQSVSLSFPNDWEALWRNDSSSTKDHFGSQFKYVNDSGSAIGETETSSVSGKSWSGAIATFKQ